MLTSATYSFFHGTTHPQTPNHFKFFTHVRASVLYKIVIGTTNVCLENFAAIFNFVKNTFLHTPPTVYIRFPQKFLAIINPPKWPIPIKRLAKYCSPLKLLANEHKRGGALEINSHKYPNISKQINCSGALQHIRHFVPFWQFFTHFCTFVDYVFQQTPPTPLSQFLRNSLRLFASPQRLKFIKRSSNSQRAWPGRSQEVRCFATKLHTALKTAMV